ncbi:hypothetical protein VTO42DRAFT_7308 [Malbranchea cinnamomea]
MYPADIKVHTPYFVPVISNREEAANWCPPPNFKMGIAVRSTPEVFRTAELAWTVHRPLEMSSTHRYNSDPG